RHNSSHDQGPPGDRPVRGCRRAGPGTGRAGPGTGVRGDRPQQATGRAARPDRGLLLPLRAGRSSAAAICDRTAGGRAALLRLFWTVFGSGAPAGSIVAGLARRLPVWPVLVAAVIGWGAALTPLGLLRLPALALAFFAVGGLLYAPYPALSATLFQRESPPGLPSQVLAARGALTLLATPL